MANKLIRVRGGYGSLESDILKSSSGMIRLVQARIDGQPKDLDFVLYQLVHKVTRVLKNTVGVGRFQVVAYLDWDGTGWLLVSGVVWPHTRPSFQREVIQTIRPCLDKAGAELVDRHFDMPRDLSAQSNPSALLFHLRYLARLFYKKILG